jgi:hypothetical protein
MPIITAQDLISFSMRAVGVLSVGQTLAAEDNADALSALNGLVGQWNRKRWLIWHLLDIYLPTTGNESYTIGPGGQFNVPRPDRLEAAFFRQYVSGPANQVDYPLEILESREDYNEVVLKSLVSWPTYIFYDASVPLGYVYPWPVPQASIYELHLTVKDVLVQFVSFTQVITLPPEYVEALWTNLALRLAAIYPGAEVTPALDGLAKASLATIRGANAQIPLLNLPGGLGRGSLYNIYSDRVYQPCID